MTDKAGADRLAETMALYAAYHRDPRNRLTHFFGVPIIIFSLFIALSYARFDLFGLPVNGAVLLVAAVGLHYLRLDVPIGTTLVVLMIPLLMLAAWVTTAQPVPVGIAAFLATFIGGWAIQLLGHKFEGNRPALTQNFFQTLVAPLFLTAEAFFALGLRRELRNRVERLVERHVAPDAALAAPQNR